MNNQFSALEIEAAEIAATEGKTHVVVWGRTNKFGYEVDVYSLPRLNVIHSGYSDRKVFRELDRATGINLIELRRRARTLKISNIGN